MTIERDLQTLDRLQADALTIPSEIDQLTTSLRERVRAGFSTGDRIRDFVILAHDLSFVDFEKQVEYYRHLESTLAAHSGEFILVVDETGRSRTQRYLGIITEPYLDFGAPNNPFFQIVTPKHVQSSMLLTGNIHPLHSQPGLVESFSKLMQEVEQKAKRHLTGATRLGQEVQLFSATLPIIYSRPLPSMMIIGDQPVLDFFTDQGLRETRTMRIMAFNKMMQIIGRRIPLPEEAEEVITRETQRQKRDALTHLQDLVRQEEAVRIEMAARSLPIPNTDENALAETAELQRRGKLHELRRKHAGILSGIKHGLKEAFNLGLHRETWVITEEPEPGRRVEVDVRQLIRGYCEKFEIQLPQD